jgi:hypothetical protein
MRSERREQEEWKERLRYEEKVTDKHENRYLM